MPMNAPRYNIAPVVRVRFCQAFDVYQKRGACVSVDVVEGKVVKLLQGCRAIPVNLKGPRPRRPSKAGALG